MNKNIGILLAVIVIAGGAYFLMHKKSDDAQNQTKGDASSASTENTESESSLKNLLASGKSQKCTFSMDESGATSTGTFYVSNGKSRGDISSTVAGKVTTTHMIYDNNSSYVWMNDSTTGFKMAINKDDVAASQQNAQAQGVDPNKNYKFSCSGWTADNSMFQAPSNVEFKDFAVPKIPVSSSTSAGANAMMNADTVCAALSGSAKEQCVASFNKK